MRSYGGFDPASREYVIRRPETPVPWINYLIGRDMRAFISQSAGGMAFYRDASAGRLTRYRFNGLPVDSPGFYLYVQDGGGAAWNPSFRPVRTPLDGYECRHGLGYTSFDSHKDGLRVQVTYLVPPGDPVMLWSLRLTNATGRRKRVRLTTYLEFSLHGWDRDDLWYLVCGNQWRLRFDRRLNGIVSDYFAFEAPFEGKSIFASTLPVKSFDIDREAFIGPGRNESNPIGLERGLRNSEVPDGGRYACGALQGELTLCPGESRHVLYAHAASDDFRRTRRAVRKYRTERDVNRARAKLAGDWERALSSAQVGTPDPSANVMLNTWLPYNAFVTFHLGRSVSARHTGTCGSLRFRDSMQDAMPAAMLFPAEARVRILRILNTMFADGHCASGVDPNTLKADALTLKIIRSDAAVWGVFTIYQYVAETGDAAILDEIVPYYDKGKGSVFEHLFRGLRFIATNTGKDGLPNLFTVDWNDFLHIFTVSYKGCQSVMVAQQFIYAARLLADMAHLLGRGKEEQFLRQAVRRFTRVLESNCCWDGDWYRRVLGDGLTLGSRRNRDANIFLNTQSWAAIAGTLDPRRVRRGMDSAHRLLNTDYGLRLFAPPFRRMPDGSRVPAHTPGAGENGGIFVHANTWAIIAECLLGRGDRAWQYFSQVLPPQLSQRDPDRYGNEPYAFTSWIYGPDHERYGAGQLSWLTGGAAWMYHAGLQYILGVRPELDRLVVDPCIPSHWRKYDVMRHWRGTKFHITVHNPHGISKGDIALTVDGKPAKGNAISPSQTKSVRVHATLMPRDARG